MAKLEEIKKDAETEKSGLSYEGKIIRAAWKLKGIAGLFVDQGGDDGKALDPDEANGIYYLLEDIANDILTATGNR